jgi:hypothetical protein
MAHGVRSHFSDRLNGPCREGQFPFWRALSVDTFGIFSPSWVVCPEATGSPGSALDRVVEFPLHRLPHDVCSTDHERPRLDADRAESPPASQGSAARR